MKTSPAWNLRRRLGCAAWLACAAASTLPLVAATSIQTDHDAYYPGEDILISFAGGPGGAKDWIGVYQPEQEPGPVPSTIWRYVDGTQTGAVGFQNGTVSFPAGLALSGDWVAYFLLNDGYTVVATNQFKVVDPGSPLVRANRRSYTVGDSISISFTNGPANPKDWVGIYKEGEAPGGPQSTLWSYVDGTQNGNVAHTDGTVTFASGLATAGNYVVHFLLNDGYDILATETFRVEAASASVLPRIVSVSPSEGASNVPPLLSFSATITNGTAKVVTSSVKLELDGAVVAPQVVAADGLTTVTHSAAALPAAGSQHRWVLTFADDGAAPVTQRVERTITVGSYVDVQLPTPLYFENFDAVAEGGLPAGWTQKSYTVPLNEAVDFTDLGSAAYGAWVAVDASRFTGSFKTYGNPESSDTDYRRVLSVNPFNVVNGRVLNEPLAQGRFLFANSGYQNGSASQVLYLFTRDYDLTGKTNVHLAFKSLWEQNQDSIAAIEYSIDQGANWLPVAYFLNAGDVLKVEGTEDIDATATFTAEYSDVARYVDDTGAEVGGTYGTFIAAPIDANLAPAIQARVDDDRVGSKRVEFFAIPRADNQRTVRIRFAHAGTDSWYFGIDDFGLYSVTSGGSVVAPTLTVVREGTGLKIAWPADASGFRLESSPTAQSGSWTAVTGVSGTTHTVTPSGSAGFYRLTK